MKAATVSTLAAILVAVSLLLRKRGPKTIASAASGEAVITDETRRYDIDDFLTT